MVLKENDVIFTFGSPQNAISLKSDGVRKDNVIVFWSFYVDSFTYIMTISTNVTSDYYSNLEIEQNLQNVKTLNFCLNIHFTHRNGRCQTVGRAFLARNHEHARAHGAARDDSAGRRAGLAICAIHGVSAMA